MFLKIPSFIYVCLQKFDAALNTVFPSAKNKRYRLPGEHINPNCQVTIQVNHEADINNIRKVKKEVQQVVVRYNYPSMDLSNDDDILVKEKICNAVDEEAKTIFEQAPKSSL